MRLLESPDFRGRQPGPQLCASRTPRPGQGVPEGFVACRVGSWSVVERSVVCSVVVCGPISRVLLGGLMFRVEAALAQQSHDPGTRVQSSQT